MGIEEFYWFIISNLDWRLISIYGIVFLFFIEALDKKLYKRIYKGIPFCKQYVFLAVLGLIVMFDRILMTDAKPPPYADPTIGLILSIISFSHLRSFIFYSALIIYLWHKFDRLIPALYGGWFGIGCIEMTFIAQHYILRQSFMGIEWYLPFFIIMIPFLYDRKKYKIGMKTVTLLLVGVSLQYLSFLWHENNFAVWVNGFPVQNVAAIMNPTLDSWMHELVTHIMKSFMTIAFAYMEFKKDD